MINMKNLGSVALAVGLTLANQLSAQQAETPFLHIPSTVSPEAQTVLRMMPDPSLQPGLPAPADIETWKAVQQARETFGLERQKPIVERLQPSVKEMHLGGVPVLEIKPRNWKDNG